MRCATPRRAACADGSLPPAQPRGRWTGSAPGAALARAGPHSGPSGGVNSPTCRRPTWPSTPSISADGSTVVWDADRADISAAERLGEIHARAAGLGQRRFSVMLPSRTSSKRPRSAYNSVVSADGGTVALKRRSRRTRWPSARAR